MRRLLLLAVLLAGCGSNSPTAPTPIATPTPTPAPVPAPTTIAITGTITNTVSGAPVGTFTATTSSFPAKVMVSAAGFLARETSVANARPTVDLIPDAAPFSLIFYRQLARGTLEGSAHGLFVLSQAPSFYLQTGGLSSQAAGALADTIRAMVPLWTGGRFSVSTLESGSDARTPRTGWITIGLEQVQDGASCGRAFVGLPAGEIWLNTAQRCSTLDAGATPGTLAHELGHAFGFEHIDVPSALMFAGRSRSVTTPTDLERYHAAIAYKRSFGNRDVDIDPSGVVLSSGSRVIMD